MELNAAKSTSYIEKCFKQKLSEIKFPTKNSLDAYLYLTQEWNQGLPNTCHFLNNALKWESRLTLWLNVGKSTDCVEKCFKQKLYQINFLQKAHWVHMSISRSSGAKRLQRFAFYYCYCLQGIFTLRRAKPLYIFASVLAIDRYALLAVSCCIVEGCWPV